MGTTHLALIIKLTDLITEWLCLFGLGAMGVIFDNR